ncbi:hypothetical protein ACETU7_06810 [Rhodococcus sp. 3Y1]
MESTFGQGIEQSLAITKVLARSRVAHARLTRELPQRQLVDAISFECCFGRRQEFLSQAAVMIRLFVGGHGGTISKCCH